MCTRVHETLTFNLTLTRLLRRAKLSDKELEGLKTEASRSDVVLTQV